MCHASLIRVINFSFETCRETSVSFRVFPDCLISFRSSGSMSDAKKYSNKTTVKHGLMYRWKDFRIRPPSSAFARRRAAWRERLYVCVSVFLVCGGGRVAGDGSPPPRGTAARGIKTRANSGRARRLSRSAARIRAARTKEGAPALRGAKNNQSMESIIASARVVVPTRTKRRASLSISSVSAGRHARFVRRTPHSLTHSSQKRNVNVWHYINV
jgi:hypothetical protein